MTRSNKNPVGRPRIEQPEMVWGRVSVEVKDEINDLADRLGIPKSRVVATLLEVGLANQGQAEFPRSTRIPEQQQELPLTRAS
ncbi:hypothetical protein [Pseudonocardia spinosispora]|uniref:hypothetical protein n=1 Tax=Pseudonocardia spinosispora TaxID=103441 RepID=UPI0004250003|nr:hypothetical protein [Pseudonocardia spinosispora]